MTVLTHAFTLLCFFFAALPLSHTLAAGEAPKSVFEFPRDHLPHDEFNTEWWYLTANLQDTHGNHYGIQFTLFAQRVAQHHRLWFAHAALSTSTQFFFAERYTRADMGNAGVTPHPWRAFMDHWCLCAQGEAPLPASLSVRESAFAYRLQLDEAMYIAQGEAGFSRKDASGEVASFYYNAPFIQVSGELDIKGRTVKVKGSAWLDREWSNTLFSSGELGWDWLSLRIDDDRALLLFRFRDVSGEKLSAFLLHADGRQVPIPENKVRWHTTRYREFLDRRYPIESTLEIPSLGIDLRIQPINEQQFLSTKIPYWEGAVVTRGSHTGSGYLELFGRRAP